MVYFAKKNSILKQNINIIFIFACLFGLLIRIYPDGHSLWLDELYSVTITYKWNSLYEMFWNEMIYETHPPLYQFLLYYWIRLFGDSDYIVRVPSMIFGISSIIITYLYGRKLFNIKDIWVLTAFVAVSWGGIYYSHEARNYSFLFLLSAILMLKSLKLIMMNRDITFRDISGIFILGFLLCHTHYFGYLLYFLNLISLLFFLNLSRRKIIYLTLFSAIIFAPWLVVNLSHISAKRASWIANVPLCNHFMGFFTLFIASKCAFGILVILVLYRIIFQLDYSSFIKDNRILYALSIIFFTLLFSLLINHYNSIIKFFLFTSLNI